MTIDNLDDRLAKMQDAFNQASTDDPFELPPDGDYQALVKRFDFFEARDQIFLKTELEVCNDPTYSGRPAETVHNLEDPERLAWLKRHLQTLGADVDSLELSTVRPGSAVLEALCDTPVEITIKTSDRQDKNGKNYRNVYVNARLGEPLRSDVPAGDTFTPPAAVAEDDKIPF